MDKVTLAESPLKAKSHTPDDSPPTTAPQLAIAIRYATRFGWPVFPCRHADKRPLTAHGFKDAATDTRQIEAWWRRHPDALIGVPTGAVSGLVIVDLDEKDGKSGAAELRKRGLKLGPTWRTLTRSGGAHFYHRHPGWPVGNTVCWPFNGVDLRGDGGYVIAPGFRAGWRWAATRPGNGDLLPLPDWLLRAIERRQNPPAPPILPRAPVCTGHSGWLLAAILHDIAAAQPGGRQALLAAKAWKVGRLVAEGRAGHDEAVAGLLDAVRCMNGQATKNGPWDVAEALETARRQYEAGRAR